MRKLLSLILTLAILAGAVAGARILVAMRKAPPQASPEERPIAVEVARAALEDVPVTLEGHGKARALDVVAVAPEVAGRVVAVHPRLDPGEVIPAGEELVRIDPRNYEAALAQARAQKAQAEKALARLREKAESDRARLSTLERSRDLARNEFERVSGLLKNNQVGSQSSVEKAEAAYNQARDACDLLRQAVSLYPLQIAEAEQSLEAADAAVRLAEANLDRCVIRVPFTARVKDKNVEAGQYISPGAPVMTLADDSLLEISMPLDSRDAARWLPFAGGDQRGDASGDASDVGKSWFPPLEPVVCRVFWTDAPSGHPGWDATLHRVERFEEATRTVTVALRVTAEQARAGGGFPLVEGMFCRAEIPGRALNRVVRLPRSAVSFEGYVWVVDADNRLQRREVEVARNEGDYAFVSGGIEEGEQVVITRLVNPLPGSKVQFEASKVPSTTALSGRPADAVPDAGGEEAGMTMEPARS